MNYFLREFQKSSNTFCGEEKIRLISRANRSNLEVWRGKNSRRCRRTSPAICWGGHVGTEAQIIHCSPLSRGLWYTDTTYSAIYRTSLDFWPILLFQWVFHFTPISYSPIGDLSLGQVDHEKLGSTIIRLCDHICRFDDFKSVFLPIWKRSPHYRGRYLFSVTH